MTQWVQESGYELIVTPDSATAGQAWPTPRLGDDVIRLNVECRVRL
jgi:hypothetical protein